MENGKREPYFWRNIIAYWILGLSNNIGFFIMLSAAFDIIENRTDSKSFEDTVPGIRHCSKISTAAILFANILPAFIVKLLQPFLVFWVHLRIAFAVLLEIGSIFLIAFATVEWMALLGVVMISLSCGIGETTFLAYSSKFHITVISAWSSGTGAAGVIGSLSYAGLRDLKFSTQNTVLSTLFIPIFEFLAFWAILRKPIMPQTTKAVKDENENPIEIANENYDGEPLETLRQKFNFIPYLLEYMIPLSWVYLFQYVINLGLFELIYFRGISMSLSSQYRWLNFDYQVGVFISRSSTAILYIRVIWLMAMLQCFNFILLIGEAIFFYISQLWIIFFIVFWEGLLGGAAYVNTYHRIATELPENRLVFAMSFVSLSSSAAILAAGLIAIPLHQAICTLPEPKRA